MKTGIIKFNVTERGRQHRGQPRNFDTAALAAVVNGPEVQERVSKRDMHGYFGHWPRRLFGMEPGEGGIFDGKQITIEPAIVTTTLRAMPDGTIEHESEFLDTAPGRTAKRMFSSRAGGWSSAISVREYAGRDVPLGFHGFDYVTEPNFSTNRGYALDGVEAAADRAAILDDALREGALTVKVLDGLYSALQGDYERALETITRLQLENSELVDMLAKGGDEMVKAAQGRLARMDAVATRPTRVVQRLDDARLLRMARQFSAEADAGLAGFEAPADHERSGAMRVLANVAASVFQGFQK